MKLSRKIIGFALATAMVATQFTTAFAADVAPNDMGNSGTGTVGDTAYNGAGNIIYNSADKVVVPTQIRFVLNPKKFNVIMRYVEVTGADTDSPDASLNYYIVDKTGSHKHIQYTFASGAKLAAARTDSHDGKVYTVDTTNDVSNAQVLSLNYGIINKSTSTKLVKADFKISYNEDNATGTPIDFMDAANKAQGPTDSGTAKKNETKVFLQVQTTSTAVKVRQTYNRVAIKADGSDGVPGWVGTNIYYTFDSDGKYVKVPASELGTGTPNAVTPNAVGTFGSAGDLVKAIKATNGDLFYLESYSNSGYNVSPETTGAQLSDAVISPVVTGDSPQTFQPKTGATNSDAADAEVTYSLDEATYTKRDGQIIDYESTSSDVGNTVMYCSAVPGSTGFTFAGAMNFDCDWSKAKTNALKVTPRYTIRDLEVGETTEAVGTGANVGLKQAIIAKAPSADATQNILEAGKAADVVVNLGAGTKAATGVAGFVVKETGRDWIAEGGVTYANGKITIPASYVDFIRSDLTSKVFVITFDDTAGTTVEVTLGDKN
jgi:hypothetical protein